MGMGKQAKILSEHQSQAFLAWLATRKVGLRSSRFDLLSPGMILYVGTDQVSDRLSRIMH